MSDEKPTLALLNQKVDFMADDLREIKKFISDKVVTQEQLNPVRKVAYGTLSFLGVLLLAIIGAAATIIGTRK